ncbi:hypothetical protein TGFOU_316210 [Toxoplasma gondii FOU]|uniref:Uncharacterized protein n=2 Tax=Toxoplasma gondii TaxID=5811 RepID=A0A086LIH6_TOXGO|nr:hypothetical protein TGFOU_316210 [Toxoplasma gondii FOU]PUA86693.1 hypothetical protein TGBR9_316210 [Toxoplasma gondii TgCATBr9]
MTVFVSVVRFLLRETSLLLSGGEREALFLFRAAEAARLRRGWSSRSFPPSSVTLACTNFHLKENAAKASSTQKKPSRAVATAFRETNAASWTSVLSLCESGSRKKDTRRSCLPCRGDLALAHTRAGVYRRLLGGPPTGT